MEKICKISKDNYQQFMQIVQQTQWGNILLPDMFSLNLWGGVVMEGDEMIGGWVGILRGNKPIVQWVAKSVYFDSYPIFVSEEMRQKYQQLLIDTIREWAKQEHIVMLNLTHWVRGRELPDLQVEHNATFLLPLQDTSEAQMKLVESSQRNKIRKGEKNGIEVKTFQKEEAVKMIPIVQSIREQTQEHAIRNNANASMLLKSDNFFENLFLHTNSTLFIGYYEEKPVTVLVVQQSGRTACSYSGGSDYEINRKIACSAYVRWKAIEFYREQNGVEYMDVGGVPPTPEPDDPAFGVYTFKRSFGGEYMEFDAGVIPISKWKCALLKFALSQRKLLRLLSKIF